MSSYIIKNLKHKVISNNMFTCYFDVLTMKNDVFLNFNHFFRWKTCFRMLFFKKNMFSMFKIAKNIKKQFGSKKMSKFMTANQKKHEKCWKNMFY